MAQRAATNGLSRRDGQSAFSPDLLPYRSVGDGAE